MRNILTKLSSCMLVRLPLLFISFGYSSHAIACNVIEYRVGHLKPSKKTEKYVFPGSSAYVHVDAEPILTQKDIKAAEIVDAREYGRGDVLQVLYEPKALKIYNKYSGESSAQGLAIFLCDMPVNIAYSLRALDTPEAWISGMSMDHMVTFVEVIRSKKN